MKINPINSSYTNKQKTKPLKAARNGALVTAGLLTVSSGYSWLKSNNKKAAIIKDYGSLKNYFKSFAAGVFILSLAVGAISLIASTIENKITPKQNPKAVN